MWIPTAVAGVKFADNGEFYFAGQAHSNSEHF